LGVYGHRIPFMEVRDKGNGDPIVHVPLDISTNPIIINGRQVPINKFRSVKRSISENGFTDPNASKKDPRFYYSFILNDVLRGPGVTKQIVYLENFYIISGIPFSGDFRDYEKKLNQQLVDKYFFVSWSTWVGEDGSWFIGPDGDDMTIGDGEKLPLTGT